MSQESEVVNLCFSIAQTCRSFEFQLREEMKKLLHGENIDKINMSSESKLT